VSTLLAVARAANRTPRPRMRFALSLEPGPVNCGARVPLEQLPTNWWRPLGFFALKSCGDPIDNPVEN
jgi:hypothetical protein